MTYFEKLAELSANGIDWSEIPRAVLYGTFSAFETGYTNISTPIAKIPTSVNTAVEQTHNLIQTIADAPKTIGTTSVLTIGIILLAGLYLLKKK